MGVLDDLNAIRRWRQRQEEAGYAPGDQVRVRVRGFISDEVHTITEVDRLDVRLEDGTWHDSLACVRPPLDFQIGDEISAVSGPAREALGSAQTARVCGLNDESGVLIVRPAGRRDTIRIPADGCRKITPK